MKWRRRESNAGTVSRNTQPCQQVTKSTIGLSGNCQETSDADCLPLSRIDPALKKVMDAWNTLPQPTKDVILNLLSERSEVCEAITTLVDAAVRATKGNSNAK